MTRRPGSSEYENRRNARIRQLREQREGPVRRRRRVQPLLLLTWIAGTIALLVVAIVLGFNFFFAPRVMAWVEDNPGAIEHGIVQDFVRWYEPEALSDEPASDQQQRVTAAWGPSLPSRFSGSPTTTSSAPSSVHSSTTRSRSWSRLRRLIAR